MAAMAVPAVILVLHPRHGVSLHMALGPRKFTACAGSPAGSFSEQSSDRRGGDAWWRFSIHSLRLLVVAFAHPSKLRENLLNGVE